MEIAAPASARAWQATPSWWLLGPRLDVAAFAGSALLALVARYAPKNNRALWFALMTSFMNLALVGAGLLTKYLNQIFVVTRTDFSQLPALTAVVILLGFLIPYVTLVLLRDKID